MIEINLENKLILSICIRLLSEEYIISVLNDNGFWKSIQSNQTRKLIDEYRRRYNEEKGTLFILDKVNLITPEYIYLNSFMYEPLIDMSINQLMNLYDDVLALCNK